MPPVLTPEVTAKLLLPTAATQLRAILAKNPSGLKWADVIKLDKSLDRVLFTAMKQGASLYAVLRARADVVELRNKKVLYPGAISTTLVDFLH